jgi:hypothetical protein
MRKEHSIFGGFSGFFVKNKQKIKRQGIPLDLFLTFFGVSVIEVLGLG